MKLYFHFHHVVRSNSIRLAMLFSGGTYNSNILICIFSVKIKCKSVIMRGFDMLWSNFVPSSIFIFLSFVFMLEEPI